MLNKLYKNSPFFLAIFWSLLLLANFAPSIPQPDAIIGYLWKIEFILAGLIFATLLTALKFPKEKFRQIKFSKREIYLIIAPVVLFTVWSGLSVAWSKSWRNALHHTLLWACYALFYILIRQIVVRPRLLDASLKIAGIVFAILGFACLVEDLNSAEINSLFTFRYYKYAEAAVMFLPVFLALSLRLKSNAAFASGAVALLAWLLIILSYSRTEFIAGFVCLGLFFSFIIASKQFQENWKKMIALFFVLMIPVLLTQTSILKSGDNSTVSRFVSGERNQSNLQWRFLVWGISLESFKRKPLHGVGADNFGVDYRAAQESYAQRDSNNKLLDLDQHVVAERSHNEYLQILAELGVVGAVIFGWLLLGIGTFIFSIRKKEASLLSLAALAGIFAFLVSSLTSSYSFRVPANGVCFFFLLAIAANELLKREKGEAESEKKTSVGILNLKPIFVSGLLIGSTMLIFSAGRGASLMYLQMALESSDKSEAEENYQKALSLDSRDALLRYYYGQHLYNLKRADEGVPHIRFAIDNGISTSLSYFDMATAQTLSSQKAEAEKTYAEALRTFPRSVFLLTAYASFLKENGRISEAETEYQKALQIDSRQAASWQIAHDEGTEKLTKAEGYNKELLPPMELNPLDGVYSLVNFQLQKNPDLAKRDF